MFLLIFAGFIALVNILPRVQQLVIYGSKEIMCRLCVICDIFAPSKCDLSTMHETNSMRINADHHFFYF